MKVNTNKLIQKQKTSNPLEVLTIKQIRFLQEYIRTGDMSASWKKFHKAKTLYYAYQGAYKFMKNHPDARKAFFEANGITDKAIATAVVDGLNANREQIYKGEVYKFIDPYARLKAAEISNKLLGHEENKLSVGNQVNIQINTEDGSFKVAEG